MMRGVTFYSHLDGSRHFLGPKESIKIQHQLGADLIVAFDDHESINMSRDQILNSLKLTEEWGLRSLDTLNKIGSDQLATYHNVYFILNLMKQIR